MTSKIKVLQVIPTLGFGGAETGCYDLAHYLFETKKVHLLEEFKGKILKKGTF